MFQLKAILPNGSLPLNQNFQLWKSLNWLLELESETWSEKVATVFLVQTSRYTNTSISNFMAPIFSIQFLVDAGRLLNET